MKFIKFFIIIFLCSNFSYSQNVPQEIIDLGLNFLENPGDLFFNIQHNAEDVSPNLANKRVGLRINIFPSFLPTTLGSISTKVRFNSDSTYIPQIDFVGGYGQMLALKFIKTSGDTKPDSNAYYYGLTFTKSMNDKVRIYFGTKYSEFSLGVKFSSPVAAGAFSMDQLNFITNDTFLFTGIEIKTKKFIEGKKNSVIIAQTGYGLKYKKIVARVGYFGQHVEIGLDIFPEGLFIFQPFWSYHWRF